MEQTILLADLVRPADRSLSDDLARCGFSVRAGHDEAAFQAALTELRPLCVVVRIAHGQQRDWGWAFASGLPAVAVCERHDEDLIIRCLDHGAAAVIVQPVSRMALEARIRAVVRTPRPGRRQTRVSEEDAPRSAPPGASLTPTERRLFSALARRDGRTATHDELAAEVWGGRPSATRENLRFYIRHLRRKLGGSSPEPAVINHRGVGYRLAPAFLRRDLRSNAGAYGREPV